MITVAETETFQSKINKLLSKEEKDELIAYLSEHPSAGDLIQGTGALESSDGQRQTKAKAEASGLSIIFIAT
ncbi:hypothetical protein [Methylotuvimicrobium sp.]|uniref:hypothetical protein n=1 Tax=Methylotuvimicrobium sp. TaxID=2822413 RepID=UPI003D65454A